MSPSALVDEGYIVVGAHLDLVTVEKISNGEYVDFSKLLPRDRVIAEEDTRMEMIVKNGRMYWVPVANTVNINSFAKWEQAFRSFPIFFVKLTPTGLPN